MISLNFIWLTNLSVKDHLTCQQMVVRLSVTRIYKRHGLTHVWKQPSLYPGAITKRVLYVNNVIHCSDVIMDTMASQVTSLTIVYSIVCSDADQRRHQSSASPAFVRGIHRWPVNSPHKRPVTRKMFPFDDVVIFRNTSQLNITGLCHVPLVQYRSIVVLIVVELARLINCGLSGMANIWHFQCMKVVVAWFKVQWNLFLMAHMAILIKVYI